MFVYRYINHSLPYMGCGMSYRGPCYSQGQQAHPRGCCCVENITNIICASRGSPVPALVTISGCSVNLFLIPLVVYLTQCWLNKHSTTRGASGYSSVGHVYNTHTGFCPFFSLECGGDLINVDRQPMYCAANNTT